MCAIFGLLDYKGNLESVQRLRIVKALGTAAEIRGTDAAGIAFFQRGRLNIQKAPKPAHKMKYRIPAGVRVIIGHTRMTTQGHASKNQNNHPFPGKTDGRGFALAHNGILYNDKELRYNYNLPETNIETDSYIAVQLIEKQKEVSFNSLQRMAELLEGTFTITILDQDNNLYFVKGSNPLMIYHYPELGLYLYASTKIILEAALKSLGMEILEPEIIEPQEGMILMIDRHGEQSYSYFAMEESYPMWIPQQHSLWFCDSRQQYIQELKEVAGCYGYTPEDIDGLLLDGFTADEVAEMICY